MKKQIRIAIIGAGLIGRKRAEAIKATGEGTLTLVADVNEERAKVLAEMYGAEATTDWKKAVARKDVDAVIVAVPNATTIKIVLAALAARKHVLSEKPFGITAKEAWTMLVAAKKARRQVKVGFNHRFHAGIWKAHEIFEKGGIGKVMFIRARYGHGGRKGMEKEWRFDKKISGGGELLDQGVHVIDLARWFGGEFKTAYGFAETKFWDTKLDDNAFALMKNDRVTFSFHVSTTQWRNLFSFEVYGDDGFLEVMGKGGSYGEEVLTYAKKNLGMAPTIEVFKFEGGDQSWAKEWNNFISAVRGEGKVVGGAMDGFRANQGVEAIYRSSRTHKEVKLTRK